MAGRATQKSSLSGSSAGRGSSTRSARGAAARTPARRATGSARRPVARRPAKRGPDLVDRGIDAVGRGIVALGRSVGRALGRTRELDPAHRRDGLGVVLLVLAVISAAGIWWEAGGPVGRWFSLAVGYVIGLGAGVLPVVLLGAAIVLVATEPHPEARPRVAVGTLLLALGVLGLVHLAAGSPDEPALWNTGGGALGYLAATPLATGLTAWVAVPV
ncbi:MAG TPA: DNA translocase FtsK 4TM domain-containing protein, partial [Pseudonocardia sp.]|nr:DNA translocase FtsK 4TM domain-containing protein [Pseudonocardia sp.]